MKTASFLLAALGWLAVHAEPMGSSSSDAAAGTVAPAAGSSSSSKSSSSTSKSPLDSLTTYSHPGEWHMKPVRVVHARVQKDTPKLSKGRFVSSIGGDDFDVNFRAALDTVNTASVEGALMYVQAECINVKARGADERCVRKNKVRNIVFYEIYIANTNESIAEYQETWNAPEYGPMAPMDGGKCSPVGPKNKDGTDNIPPECLQYNGDNGQPNVGPVVGGGIKEDEPRAKYPGNYWFSFPNSCPLQPWGDQKTDACREKTRKGLCPAGKMPDGVTCTFTYDILGWVPLDDVVGITNITNPETNQPYVDFEQWCTASKSNIEFKGDTATNQPEEGVKFLPFWQNPLDINANLARAAKVIQTYNMIVDGTFVSTQIGKGNLTYFKPLPSVASLRKQNPPCYYSVKKCSEGFGCSRQNYSQICVPCSSKADGCEVNATYKYPTLAKAARTVSDSSLSSGSKLAGKGATSSRGSGGNAAPSVTIAISTVLASLIAALML